MHREKWRNCKLDPEDETTLRKAETTLACFLAIFDIYTDINTVYTLFTSQEDQLCSYNCPAVLGTTLCAFILYSMISQAYYVYHTYDNKLYGFLSLLGYGPVVIAMDMWDDITNNTKYRRYINIYCLHNKSFAFIFSIYCTNVICKNFGSKIVAISFVLTRY